MTTTRVAYTGDGARIDYPIPFPYLAAEHVVIRVNGVEAFPRPAFLNASTIRFSLPPAANSVVELQRKTPLSTALADYQNGAVLTAEDLNLGVRQSLYLIQELQDQYDILIRSRLEYINGGGTATEPGEIIQQIANLVLETAVLNNFRQALADAEFAAQAVINEALGRHERYREDLRQNGVADVIRQDLVAEGLTRLQLGLDLTEVKEFIEGGDLDTKIINLIQTTEGNNTALVETLALIGARTPDGTAFLLDVSKVLAAPGETLATRFAAIQADFQEAQAQIVAESTARATAIGAIASTLSVAQAAIESAVARISTEETARATADTALASRIDTVEAGVSGVNARVTSEVTALVTADTALASRIDIVEADVEDADARITSEVSILAAADSVLASRIDAIVAEIDDVGGSTSAEIIAERIARIDADLVLASSIESLAATVDTEDGVLFGLISDESEARVAGDTAIAEQQNVIVARVTAAEEALASADERIAGAEALIFNEGVVRSNAISAEANQRTLLAAKVGALGTTNGDGAFVLNTANVLVGPGYTLQANLQYTDDRFVQAENLRAFFDASLGSRITAEATRIDGLLVRIGNAEGAIVNEQTVRTNGLNALASDINVVATSVGNLGTTVSTLQSSIDGIRGRWGVEINNNGFISGILLNSNGARSDFNVVADSFRIVNPGFGPQVVFEVTDGVTRIRNAIIGTGNVGWANLDITQFGRLASAAGTSIIGVNTFGGSTTYGPLTRTIGVVQPSGVFTVELGITVNWGGISPLLAGDANIADSLIYLIATDAQGNNYRLDVPYEGPGTRSYRLTKVFPVQATTPFNPTWQLVLIRGPTNISAFDAEFGRTTTERSVRPEVRAADAIIRWSFV
jgi:hypothetical protein